MPDPAIEIADLLTRVRALVESAAEQCPRCIELELLCADLIADNRELERQLDEIAGMD